VVTANIEPILFIAMISLVEPSRAALHLEAGPNPLRLIVGNFSPFWVGGQPQPHIINIL
jgi:hypothetical protein